MKQITFIFIFIFLCGITVFSIPTTVLEKENTTPDLIVINQVGTPDEILLGSNFSVSCQVMNIGTASAGNNRVGYYLSQDTLWDASVDTYLGKDNVGNINAGSYKQRSQNITLPNNVVSGNYYILFVADHEFDISESDETNNVSYLPLVVFDPLPNLATFNNSDTLSIVGTNISIELAVENTGLITSPTNEIAYYLSLDTNITTADYLIGVDQLDALAVNDTTYKRMTVDMATLTAIPAGVYYAGYILDNQDDVIELDELDNISSFSTIQITKPALTSPDLVMQNAALSSTVGNIAVTSEVKNIGTGNAGNNKLGYYLSQDTLWDANVDTYLGEDNVGSINAGAYKQRSQNLTLPINLVSGNYYVLFVADYEFDVNESDETNNVSYLPLVVVDQLPNLATFNNSDTLSINGTIISIELAVENTGLSTSPTNEIAYYLSLDTNITTADYLIGIDQLDTLAINDTTYKTMTVDMATLTAIPAGVYYAGYILDNQNDVIELNELDNISSFSTLQITKPTFTAPDLVMQTAALSSTTAPTAGSIAVTSKVKNIGTGNAGASQLSYYLSANASLNPNNDVLLTIDQVSVLNPNDTDNETATLTIPSGTAAGNYHILFVADALNNVNESDENNNVLAKAITVTGSAANLKVQSGSTNLAVNGTTIDINFIVGNDGTDTSGNSAVGYYLSTDASITTSDYLIGTDNVGALAVGNTSTESITIDISSFGNIPTGNYYIGLLIDHQNAVSETNENDNQYFWSSPLYSHTSTSIPDLIVQNATVDTTTISTGSIIHTTAQVKNAGLGTAVASMLGYYLSTDPTFDPNVDIFLGDDQVNVLNSNETDGETGHLTIPTNTMNGTYYLLFVADYIAAVVETNENNNVSYKIITVNNSTVGVPNLRIQANTAVLSVSGTSVNIDIVVENNGTDTADASMVYYYLSANTSIDASDYLIGTDAVALLAPNENSQKIFAIDISTLVSIPTGTYYIGCVVDAQNVVIENDETDNSYYWTSTQATQLPYSPADLTVNSAVATPNSLAQGSNLSVTAQVQNIGASMALPTQVGYYLSSDNVLDSSTDVFLGQSALDTIAVNESLTVSATLPIPTNISNGTYYILVVANDLSSILEGDVTNNVSAMMITVDSDYSISPFAFTPTNQSGIFLGQATVAQNAASPNDWIAAFDTSGNCAGAAQIINNNGIGYISLTIYGDDPNTSVDEGIGSGEYFTLKLYDASANRFRDYPSFDVKNQFTQWSNVNGGIMPAYSSVDSVYNFVDVQTDTILLNTGWNLISFDLLPYDSSLTTIFDELIVDNTLEYVIGFNGGSTFYDANGQPFLNTLTHIDNGYGYWVKVNTADTVVLKGWPMSVADHKIDLNTGWNLAAYVPQTMATPESYYQTLIDSSSLTYITGFDNGNQFFNPNGQPFLNTLTHLNNGFGYWVKVSTSFDGLSYRGSGFAPTNVYDFVNGSTNLTEAEYVGEEINVLDEEGNIVATLAIIQGGYVMTTSLYGDDLLTSQKDGIDINDPLYFEFRGQILDVGVVFEGSMRLFQVNLQYNKAMLTNTNEVGQEFVQFNCYPNPTSGEFTIEVNKEIKELFITDANGKVLRSLTNIQKGTRRVDLSGFPSGMYFLRYIDGETTGSKRIILVK